MSLGGTAARLILASQSPNPYGGIVTNVGNGSVIVENTVPPYITCNPQKAFAAFGRNIVYNSCVPNSFWMNDTQKAAPPQYVVGRKGYYGDAYGNAYTGY